MNFPILFCRPNVAFALTKRFFSTQKVFVASQKYFLHFSAGKALKMRFKAAILKGCTKYFYKPAKSFYRLPKSFLPFPAIVKASGQCFGASSAINGRMAEINTASPKSRMEEGIGFSGLANSLGVVPGYFCVVGKFVGCFFAVMSRDGFYLAEMGGNIIQSTLTPVSLFNTSFRQGFMSGYPA